MKLGPVSRPQVESNREIITNMSCKGETGNTEPLEADSI